MQWFRNSDGMEGEGGQQEREDPYYVLVRRFTGSISSLGVCAVVD